MSRLRFWLLTFSFDIYWGLAVGLRERIWLLLGGSALFAWLLCPRDIKLRVLLAALGGIALDSLWLKLDLFSFSGSAGFPAWMLALWLMFACWWWLTLSRFALNRRWQVAIGALGGPFSYLVGERLGGLQWHQPPVVVLTALAVGWALYLPFASSLLRRKE
ncbi:DUF2878 domain-containing protein [Erwinia sorbitola]|uniref:DUF2878 family protein n=1 Tax=Erwinia sorbitola TaxID=2681984 RepID=A0A6I6EEN7_9GAMM|nr:DUF2878 domain-containing protein [Erwinia sorbitola]MTD26718.1 DUF2878 family protein [Erwinia sorbitola]QGU88287.1 DUF2878 family protein [Erwinia sorbitola]